MFRHRWALVIPFFSALPFVLAASQEAPAQEQTAEQVFKNIQVFKGVPAKDLIPSMKFMSASLKVECTFCHDKTDFSIETRPKETARHMIEMQRDINKKFFNGRLQVTCNSCHNGHEEPRATPVLEGVRTRHERFQTTTKPEDLIKKHLAAVGSEPASITLTGTVQKEGEKDKKPYVLVQAPGNRYMIKNGDEKMGSDGKQVWFSEGGQTFPLSGEGEYSVDRYGQSWRNAAAFAGLTNLSVSGKEPMGKSSAIVVRGTRTSQGTTEEYYFDEKTGLLDRVVVLTRSTLGTVVTTLDYEDYRSVKGVKVPFRFITSTGGNDNLTVQFKSGETASAADDKLFAMPKGS